MISLQADQTVNRSIQNQKLCEEKNGGKNKINASRFFFKFLKFLSTRMAHAFEIFLWSNNVTHIESLMNIKAALLKICRKLYSGSTWKSSPTHTLGVDSFNLWKAMHYGFKKYIMIQ